MSGGGYGAPPVGVFSPEAPVDTAAADLALAAAAAAAIPGVSCVDGCDGCDGGAKGGVADTTAPVMLGATALPSGEAVVAPRWLWLWPRREADCGRFRLAWIAPGDERVDPFSE